MKPTPEPSPDPLERAVHRTLRALPPRRAPRTLELRVLAELERRAALPWWHRSFAHWPLAARAAFIVFSAVLVKLTIAAALWVTTGVESAGLGATVAAQFTWVETGWSLLRTLAGYGERLFHSIPSLWLYGAAAVIAALYATLFGLGAAAYRTLYASR